MSRLVPAPGTFALTASLPKSPCDLLPLQISTFPFSLRWWPPLPNSSLLPTVIFEPSMVFLAGLCPHQHQATPVLPPAWPPPLFHFTSHAETTSRLQSPSSCPAKPILRAHSPSLSHPYLHFPPEPITGQSAVHPQALAWQPPGSSSPHLPPRSDRETTLPSSPGTQDLEEGLTQLLLSVHH